MLRTITMEYEAPGVYIAFAIKAKSNRDAFEKFKDAMKSEKFINLERK